MFELSALLFAQGCQGRVRHAVVSNTEVMIALSMSDTVHYGSHVDGDVTSKYKELIGEVRNTFRCFRTEKISGLGRYASDDDDKNVENFKRMHRYGRYQDGQNKGKGAPRPTALVVIRCKNLCCTAYHRRENVYSARHTFHSSLHLLRLRDDGSFPRSCTK